MAIAERVYSFKRQEGAPHITVASFEGTRATARIFSPERGLLGAKVYRVRFYDRFGDAEAGAHSFNRYAAARDFVVKCFIAGTIA